MKKLIRRGVFETNSSSSHSVSIGIQEDKQFILDTIYPDENGVITITGEEFGWEWFKHNDAMTKAQYAAQQFKYDEESLETLKEVIMEQTGAEDVVFDLEDGYIDHDSHGIIEKSTLRDFIFNKNSWLFGGNDNSTVDPIFYHVPEIKDGKVILPKYKYELVIEGMDRKTKFLKEPTKEEIEDAIDALTNSVVYTYGTFKDEDIIWSLTRNDGSVYEKSYQIPQNYETKEIIFSRKNSNNIYHVNNNLRSDPGYDKLKSDEKRELFLKELSKIPNEVICVKFNVNEI